MGWIGTASTEWNVGENWASGNVPNENTETVYITKTNNQPVISSEVKLTGKIELVDGAKLTISEGGSLSIDANNITFGTDSSIVVDGTLNLKLPEDFTVGSNFAKESKGIIFCTDDFNLIIDTEFTALTKLENSSGTITINSGKNVTCNSISAATLENNGNLTLNDDSSIKNLSNNGTIKIVSEKKLSVSGSDVTLGTIEGTIELNGSTDLWYLDLSKSTDGYDTIIVNKEKDENEKDKNVKFGNWQTSKIKNVVVEKGITTFDTPIEIEKFSTSENAGDITYGKNIYDSQRRNGCRFWTGDRRVCRNDCRCCKRRCC